MKNKIIILMTSVMMFAASAQAKDTNATAAVVATAPSGAELATINKVLEDYKKLQLAGDLEATLEYIYPAVFNIMPKEQLRDSFKRAQAQGNMPKITTLDQQVISDVKTYDKGQYVIVEYDMNMTMDATPNIPKDDQAEADRVNKMLNDPKEFGEFRIFMRNMLKMSMGSKAVIEGEEDSLKFKIEKPGHYFMINEENKGWKIIDIMPETSHQFKPILPKEIVKNEKEFFPPSKAEMAAMANKKPATPTKKPEVATQK